MKTKVLIGGCQETVIDDFFLHADVSFTCMTTSLRMEDVKLHFECYEPEVFVYGIGKDIKSASENLRSIKQFAEKYKTIIVLIGDKTDVNGISDKLVDVKLIKPISIRKIEENINKKLHAIELERQKEEKERAEKEKEEKERREKEEKRKELERKKEEARLAEERLAAEEKSESTEKKHILIVDDDPVMLRTVKRYLEENYIVATAPSGKFAIKFLNQKAADLVLLDYEMPEVSGSDVLKQIRENETLKNIPVVFLTGVSDASKIQAVLSMNPSGYLLKPVDRDKLYSTVTKIIG
ncbi:MAG: response regulator [Bacteroidales bacterium]|nr:response regulator [Clostridium sp.]MCM1204629.1 response regulator [Bacteroidales bacterium]